MMDIQTLQAAIDCGIVNLDEKLLRQQVEMKMKERILRDHPYSIAQLPNGRWQTYYQDPMTGKRMEIKLSSREKVIDKLISLYKEDAHNNKLTLNKLFEEWIEYKSAITESENTILRHRQHYKKYFQENPFFKNEVKRIDRLELQAFCNELVKTNHLSNKEWMNVKTILKGMLEYAMDKEYIEVNPLDRVKISVKFRQVKRKTGKTETFNTKELRDFMDYLEKRFDETKNIIFLSVELNFYLGLRVGELVALKWADWIDMTHLHVCREEIRDQAAREYRIVDHTKTNHDRFVPVIPKAIELLNRIKEKSGEEEYILSTDGIRFNSRQVSHVLEHYAKATGKDIKRTHKIRKTFASVLNANGVPIDTIRECLGHTNLQTTMAYLFDPLTNEETYERLSAAF